MQHKKQKKQKQKQKTKTKSTLPPKGVISDSYGAIQTSPI